MLLLDFCLRHAHFIYITRLGSVYKYFFNEKKGIKIPNLSQRNILCEEFKDRGKLEEFKKPY